MQFYRTIIYHTFGLFSFCRLFSLSAVVSLWGCHSTSIVLERNPAKLHQNLGFKEPASRTVCRANAMGLQRHRPPVQRSSWIQHNPLSFIILQSQQSLVIMWYQPRSLFQQLSIVHRHPAKALSYNLLNPNAIIKSIHSPTIPSEELVEG